ncbi:hypothetical protein CLAIMM_03011 [Cladophialophora immunda]|nr:hypothetical protein CLAIMM_03011 [Cladophialophora immunda]
MENRGSSGSDLVDRLVEANGGLDHWNDIHSISTTFIFSGPALAAKGFPGYHEAHLTIDAKQHRVTFHKFGNIRGVYVPTRTEVGLLDMEGPLSVRDNPRAAFRGHKDTTKWDEHHLIYFVGYAFRYYFTLPFCLRLPSFKTWEMDPHECDNGEIWRVLKVEFPDDFPTHTKIQHLYFDERYRLRRMDYNVDIIGERKASHLCFDHQVYDHLIVPTFRFANIRAAGASHMNAFVIQIKDVQVHKALPQNGELGSGERASQPLEGTSSML